MKKYIKSNKYVSASVNWDRLDPMVAEELDRTGDIEAMVQTEIKDFNRALNNVLEDRGMKPTKLKFVSMDIVEAYNDVATVCSKLVDTAGNQFDFYSELVWEDGTFVLASEVYDRTDELYEQAYDFVESL